MLSNEQLNESLIQLDGRFDQLSEDIVRMGAAVESLREIIDGLVHAIDGNGRPGIRENSIRLDQRVRVLEEAAVDSKVPRAIWLPLMLSSIISVIAIVMSALHR